MADCRLLSEALRCATTLHGVASCRNFLPTEESAVGPGTNQSKLTEADLKRLPRDSPGISALLQRTDGQVVGELPKDQMPGHQQAGGELVGVHLAEPGSIGQLERPLAEHPLALIVKQ
jgi:hypothetical protein